jgi:signal transduction histidine kinase
MLNWTASFASAIVALTGGLIFWSNPTRAVNRAVLTCSLHIAAWLFSLHLAVTAADGLIWLRWTCAIGAFTPLHFWLVKESIGAGLDIFDLRWLRRAWAWGVVAALLSALCFTDFFIPIHSTSTSRLYGWGYYAFIFGILGLYGALFRSAYRDINTVTGSRKLELQVWLGGGCATAIAILALMVLGALTHDRRYIRLQPLVVLVFYAGTAYAITTHRIFDARYILQVGMRKIALLLIVATVAYGADKVFDLLLPESFAFVLTTAFVLWSGATLNAWLNRRLQFYPQAAQARAAAFEISRRTARSEELEREFLPILKGWGQTEYAVILSGGSGSGVRGGDVELAEDSPVLAAMRELHWVTPERLVREKPTPLRDVVRQFLEEQKLGALVAEIGPALTVLVGVGVPASRRPFTFPQVTQLMELASIFESALERALYSLKAQHAEQLATVGLLGASLAHEIRNPLVTIKTFVHLLPQHHGDPAFREKFFRLIGEEVSRIDRLTVQLLDLAAPRVYAAQEVPLHSVLNSSLELVTPKANDRAVRIVTEFRAAPDLVLTDPTAARQVLLNLCFNAIQAVDGRTAEPWLKVSTRRVPEGVELAVSDNGPGIAPEIMPRLFQPFASTKTSGFGLGLAICSDILSGLGASITVDLPQPGCGATFRVIFPCPPPTS